LILLGSFPSLAIASLIAAKSTTAGTPVKSCKTTLAGLKGISTSFLEVFFQSNIFSTSYELILNSSQFLTADSKRTLILKGSFSKLFNNTYSLIF
jgi:hypothetical protein